MAQMETPDVKKDVYIRGSGRSPCCCKRGGCCRQCPPQLVANEDGQVVRVNILISVRGCCSNKDPSIYDEIPNELFQFGLQSYEFDRWMRAFDELVLEYSTARSFCHMRSIMALVSFQFRKRAAEVVEWNKELVEWQLAFNRQVLEPKGHFVKTQSHCDVTYDKNGKHRYIERWISFALNPEESERLRNEPHITGDIEDTTCCKGYDEKELCLHP